MTEQERRELQVAQKQAVQKQDGEPTKEGLTWVPEVDIMESKEAIVLHADLPGVKKENIDIDVHDGVLSLCATVDPLPERWRNVYSEYQPGGYCRRFTLGEQVDPAKITASLDNGVLTLTLPKADAHKPRKVAIR